MIRTLIVEDSAVARELMIHILSADPAIRIVGVVRDGLEAIESVARERPDVITMDIHMPRIDGLEATRRIMETYPTPIVIVSGSTDPHEAATTFRAMEAGAVALLRRPEGVTHPDYEKTARDLLQTVKLMSEVRVVRRWPRVRPAQSPLPAPERVILRSPAKVKIVALGASTGGPLVLQTILSQLPKTFPAPLLIVQHMAEGFVAGFVEWLAHSSGVAVRLAKDSETICAGCAYVAPDGFQMKVSRSGRIVLTDDKAGSPHRPSVAYLFRSVAENYGNEAVAALLTGMGSDGAEQLRALRDKGAITIAQDEASSVVFGMPREALRLDAATYVLPANRIAAALVTLANDRK